MNVDALSKWVGKIPEDVVAEMDSVAPMLRKLGYDPHANPPNYGKNFKLYYFSSRLIITSNKQTSYIEYEILKG